MPATLTGLTRSAADNEIPTVGPADVVEPGLVKSVLESLVLFGRERQRRFVVEFVIRDVTDQTGFCVSCGPTGSLVVSTSPIVGAATIAVTVIGVTVFHSISRSSLSLYSDTDYETT
ncbi:hypothetical protein ACFPM1_13155 [Halorubrum rubrum]|uniref:Uncharacterized protein n=1 Tax=Halorubrum rubrum TaxID=1126240 RepID=A0ABD5R465_9EURY|nr:hypothetical protein [Halorubrum rubrum]